MAKNWFNRSLPLKKVPLAGYALGENRLQTMRLARLCPFGIQECLPSDVHMFSHDAFLRLAPLKYPILQELSINIASYFVPDRLILGDDKTAELFSSLEPSSSLIPKLSLDSTQAPGLFAMNNLMDYFGIQAESLNAGVIIPNPLPIFQYLLIVKEYYCDEQIEAELINNIDIVLDHYKDAALGSTVTYNTTALANAWYYVFSRIPFHVNKDRDYFTSSHPNPQRGDEVYIMNPANVVGDMDLDDGEARLVVDPNDPRRAVLTDNTENPVLGFDTTVRDLLTKMAYQQFKNNLNRYGTRYNEFLAGNMGVINQDVRLQRPECINRCKGVFQISEVLQTSASESDSPLGGYAGRGLGAKRSRNIRYQCKEHGFLFHLASIVPANGYMSGAPRWFFKESGLDFALPQFNNVGEQTIYKGELFLDFATPDDNKSDFAYQERYSEYRSGRNYASAGMRQSPFTAWHLYESYDSSVGLSPDFIKANDANRIFNLSNPQSVQNVVACFKSYHYALRYVAYNPK